MNRTMPRAAGEAPWGPQYCSEAARQLGLGLRSVMRYDAGERPVPPIARARCGVCRRRPSRCLPAGHDHRAARRAARERLQASSPRAGETVMGAVHGYATSSMPT